MMIACIPLVFGVGILLVLAAPRNEHGQKIAVATAISALALALVSALPLVTSGASTDAIAPDLGLLGRAPLLRLDGLSFPWVVAAPLLALVVLAATPRALLARANIVATLATAAATEGVLLSRNAGLTALFWVLALVPGAILVLRDKADRSHAKTYGVLTVGASIPMIGAVVLLAQAGARAGLDAPLDLDALAGLSLPIGEQALPFALALAAVAIRMGLFPFHVWLPPLAQRGPVGVVGLLVGVHTGVFVVARIVLPILPEASAVAMPWVADFALVACLWGAVLALVQTDLARMLGFLAGSKAGMLLVGLASLEHASLHGALLQSVGNGAAFVGVLMVVRSIDARCGTRDVRRLGGLVTHMPRASAAFFLLAAASVGFPGSLAFVGEDLLIHGVLHAHPVVATTLLLATALNGITMFRSFCRAFLGRPAARPRTAGPPLVDDLVPRERLATSALIVLLVAFGLAPTPLLGARRDHVDRMTAAVAREPIGGSLRHEGGSAADR